ncbi:MAG: hypothetical protein QOI23_2708 [Chloroflexota bacterium]|jgi:hypothetical protein|nr:hypothetical protein [Chloroflexota bacterium]
MSEDEDLELLALQRQLDDAFQTTRPRPGFEDELWLRMQTRRPIWLRLRDGLAGLLEGIRESPAVPSAAVAVGLVVLLGAGIYTLNRLHPGGGATTAARGVDNAAPANQSASFGPLPRPAFTEPPLVPTISGNYSYGGAATLVWAGNLQVSATALPVYRYSEPTRAEADAFAAKLGATPSADVAQGGIGVYAGRDFTIVVLASVAQPPQEPYVNVSDLKATVTTNADSIAVATNLLTAHHLLPTWLYQTDVVALGGTVRVTFLRSFDVPGQAPANLIDSRGNRYGTEVDFAPGTTGAFEKAPMPLKLDQVAYPIISADQAIRALGASSAPSGGSVPVVRMTKAELVYMLVWGGDHSYYEPAYLFSGTFSNHGVPSVKRVLIPAVVPSFLTP